MSDIAKATGVPPEEFKQEYYKHNHLSTVESMPWEKMVLKVANIFGATDETKNEILRVINASRESKTINSDLLAIFKALREQGFMVAIFSNNTSGFREQLSENGIINLVDEVIVTAEIGFQKPHKEAFDVLFEKLNVKPEETIFVDDTPKSLEKADAIGYHPILFKNNEQLKSDLKKFNIFV